MSVSQIIKNKVLIYVISRYFVYGIQFISLVLIADKLGPFNYGIWGFILLILSYMNILNLGVGNSINVLIIQYKNDLSRVKDYIASAFGASLLLIVGLIVFALIFYLKPDLFGKFHLGFLFYVIVVIGILQYLNLIFSNIFRARNRIFEVAFCQSTVPILIFINVLFTPADKLLVFLVFGYLLANGLSFILYFYRSKNLRGGKIRISYVGNILHKGLYLFLYNSAYYLILTTASTFVSRYYSVEEYGIYSFSYNLGHSVLLLLEAFGFIIYPKVIDKLYSGDLSVAEKTLNSIRSNYISLAHGLMYAAIALFPILIKLFSKFENSVLMLNLMALAIILSTNSFGYNTLLIARNKEKLSAAISGISLAVNVGLCIILIVWCKIPVYLSVLSIMGSYVCFAGMCSFFAHKMLYGDTKGFFRAVFPRNLVVPYFVAILICLVNHQQLCWIPLIIFILLNKKIILEIWSTLKAIIKRPQIVDINKE